MRTRLDPRPGKFIVLAVFLTVVGLPPGPSAGSDEAFPEASIARGAKVYARACATCHGRDGAGDGPGARELASKPRDFKVGKYRIHTTLSGEGPLRTDIEGAVRRGMPGTRMPAFDDVLSDRNITDVISFILSLGPDRLAGGEPDALAMPEFSPADAARLSDGRAVYLVLGCWKCHGLDGTGGGPSAKGLKNDEGQPIRPRNFRYDPFKGGRSHETVARTVLGGFIGTPMPSFAEILAMPRESIDATAESIPVKARGDLKPFRLRAPLAADFVELSDDEWQALADENLASLADYVLSLDRRNRFLYQVFRQEPELEGRKPRKGSDE